MQESDSKSLIFRPARNPTAPSPQTPTRPSQTRIHDTLLLVTSSTMPLRDSFSQPDALSDAMLLASAGGLLDVIVYLNHGHVFANAMTGNVIFLGIAAAGGHWSDIIPRILPFAGFFLGVLT